MFCPVCARVLGRGISGPPCEAHPNVPCAYRIATVSRTARR